MSSDLKSANLGGVMQFLSFSLLWNSVFFGKIIFITEKRNSFYFKLFHNKDIVYCAHLFFLTTNFYDYIFDFFIYRIINLKMMRQNSERIVNLKMMK